MSSMRNSGDPVHDLRPSRRRSDPGKYVHRPDVYVSRKSDKTIVVKKRANNGNSARHRKAPCARRSSWSEGF